MSNFETQYLVTQYLLLFATVGFYSKLVYNESTRERQAKDAAVIHWCKCVYRSTGNAPGLVQMAGSRVRDRYPKKMDLILTAYDEILVEEPGLKLPSMYQFLEYMRGYEKGLWPEPHLANNGKLGIYKDS